MTDEVIELEELNPYYSKVIGFVDANGDLDDSGSPDHFKLLISAGTANDVKVGERVLIFALGPEMTDPETEESLGCFEIVRGYGTIVSVQVTMAVVQSTSTKTVRYQKPVHANNTLSFLAQLTEDATREDPAPFKKPKIGDFVRFI